MPPVANATNYAVSVGPTCADLSRYCVPLSKSAGDTVTWTATTSTTTLFIEFAQQPFQNMQPQPNGHYRVPCTGSTCNSGTINPSAQYGEYKYSQIFATNGTTTCQTDGHIIINR
jgi:hypothetical protein